MKQINLVVFILCSFLLSVRAFDFLERIDGLFNNFTNLADEKIPDGIIEDVNKFVSSMTKENWNQATKLKDIPIESMRDILSKNSVEMPDRVRDFMRCRVKGEFESTQELQSLLNDQTLMTCQEYFKNKLPAGIFNVDSIKLLGENVLKLPVEKVLNAPKESLKEIFKNINSYGRSLNENERKMFKHKLIYNIYGSTSNWNNDTIDEVGLRELLESAEPEALSGLTHDFVKSNYEEIKNVFYDIKDPLKKRAALKKVLSTFQTSSKNDTEFSKFIDNLGSLKTELRSMDLRPNQKDVRDGTILTNERKRSSYGIIYPETLKKHILDELNRETKSEFDWYLLVNTLAARIKEGVDSNYIDKDKISGILEAMEIVQPRDMKSKLRIIGKLAEKDRSSSDNPTYNNLDKRLLEHISAKEFTRVNEAEARTLLKKTSCFSKKKLFILLNKISSNFAEFPSNVKEMLPLAKLQTQNNDINKICMDTSVFSTACTYATGRLRTRNNITSDYIKNTIKDQMYGFTPNLANKIDNYTILDILPKLQRMKPGAMQVVLEKYLNYTKFATGANEVKDAVKLLLPKDLNTWPIQVILGMRNNLKYMDKAQRRQVFERLKKANDNELKSIPLGTVISGVSLGLNAGRKGSGLRLGSLNDVGDLFPFLPSSEIRNAHLMEGYSFLLKLQKFIEEKGAKPCLNKEQRKAIADLIIRIKGSPSEWETTKPFNCLIYALDHSQIASMKAEVLTVNACEEYLCDSFMKEDMNTMCALVTGDGEMNTEKAEMTLKHMRTEAARKLYEASDKKDEEKMICDKASIAGANAFSNSELESLDSKKVKDCYGFFGMKATIQEKAKRVVDQIIKAEGADKMTPEQLEDMREILPGMSAEHINKLPSFEYATHKGVIDAIGDMNMCSLNDKQREAWAKRIKEWRKVWELETEDLILVKNAIVILSKSEIESISNNRIKPIIPLLSDVKCGSESSMEGLLNKIKNVYGSLDASELQDMGGLASLLSESDIERLQPIAFAGLSSKAIPKMSPDVVEKIDEDALEEMNIFALASLTNEQLSEMDENSRKFVEKQNEITRIFHVAGSIANKEICSFLMMGLSCIVIWWNNIQI